MAYFGTTFNSKIADFLAQYADADGSTSSVQVVADGGQSTSIELNMNTSVVDDVGGDDTQTAAAVNLEAEIDGTPISADATATGETASASVGVTAQEGSGIQVTAESEATGDIVDVLTAETTVTPESGIVEQDKVETFDENGLTLESSTYAYYTDSDLSLFQATSNESFLLEPSPPLKESPVTLEESSVTLEESPVTLEESPVTLEESPVTLEESPVTFEESASASGDWLLG